MVVCPTTSHCSVSILPETLQVGRERLVRSWLLVVIELLWVVTGPFDAFVLPSGLPGGAPDVSGGGGATQGVPKAARDRRTARRKV